ncbi:MAG: hypothetical protein R3C14_12065 [Caldilineaceae bacterium]
MRHLMLRDGNADQVNWEPEIEAYGMAWADLYLGLRGAYNLDQHAAIPSTQRRKYHGSK